MMSGQNGVTHLFKHLLWPFVNLPNDYVVLDTETTGLLDKNAIPGIVSIGIVQVSHGKALNMKEYPVRPHRKITDEAMRIHGITDENAQVFPSFVEVWPNIHQELSGRLVVMHNALFDWFLLVDHVSRYNVTHPQVSGVFCSQRAAQPWAEVMGIDCSERGPSLDALTKVAGIKNLRNGGVHSAAKDAWQTFEVIEFLRREGS